MSWGYAFAYGARAVTQLQNTEWCEWCRDAEGNSSTLEGGVLGCVATIAGSIEHQKVGAAHIHFQAFLECLHQLRSYTEIAAMLAEGNDHIVQEYLTFKERACMQSYPHMDKL